MKHVKVEETEWWSPYQWTARFYSLMACRVVFTDEEKDEYTLRILSSDDKSHVVDYRSDRPAITNIKIYESAW